MNTITWKCPSNIALVKYWGKKGDQLPANPSMSFTLTNCYTITTLSYREKEKDGVLLVSFAYDGEAMPSFEPKLEQFFNKIETLFPFLPNYVIEINTVNTFPHSSGIASSASGMGALALCLCSMEKEIGHVLSEEEFYRKASKVARLGSGSASRSIFGPMAIWGSTDIYPESTNDYAIKLKGASPLFNTYCDSILIVEKGEKEVSSSRGHSLINDHPFAQARFEEANKNLALLKGAIEKGDLKVFTEVVEKEALMLHGLMMTSDPAYILMKPDTLAILQKVWDHRKKTNLNMTITLDAGANVHLLYPLDQRTDVQSFIQKELIQHCKDKYVIHDHVGAGPEKMN